VTHMNSVACFRRPALAAALVIAASPAFADPAPPAPAEKPAPGQQADSPDKIVCRKEMPLGSKLPVTRCTKKSIADEERRRGREFVEDAQTRSRGPWLTK
jgi:hypothetical protein